LFVHPLELIFRIFQNERSLPSVNSINVVANQVTGFCQNHLGHDEDIGKLFDLRKVKAQNLAF